MLPILAVLGSYLQQQQQEQAASRQAQASIFQQQAARHGAPSYGYQAQQMRNQMDAQKPNYLSILGGLVGRK